METYDYKTNGGSFIRGIPASIDINTKEGMELVYRVYSMKKAEREAAGLSGPFEMDFSPQPASDAAQASGGAVPRSPYQFSASPSSQFAPAPYTSGLSAVQGKAQSDAAFEAEASAPRTDPLGLMGSVARGGAPMAIGGLLGAPLGPAGMAAGAGIMQIVVALGDQLIPTINSTFGTKYSRPTDAINHWLTAVGVAEPDTTAERIVQMISAGASGAASSVGLGRTIAGMAGPLPAMASGAAKTAGVGAELASQPLSQVTGGASGLGASQAAKEAGLPPLAQTGIGIAAGMVGSRLAPDAGRAATVSSPYMLEDAAGRLTPTKAPVTPEQVGSLVKKASGSAIGSRAAKAKLAELAKVNPEARAAAERLGIDLPADVFSDSPQIRSAAGLTRSVAGSEAEAAWRNTVSNAVDRADDAIKQFDAVFVEGTSAPGVVSVRVRNELVRQREELAAEAAKLYASVDEAVPKQTPVKMDNLLNTLAEISSEVGDAGLSSQEKALMKMMSENPTYGRLLREKSLIGQALSRKESPYGNMEAGALKRLYAALAEDQVANIDAIGGTEAGQQLRTANLIYAKERALGERIISAFGEDVEGSIANKMRSSILSASKGDSGEFSRLMAIVPEDLRKETVATAFASVTRSSRGAERGGFGFSEYAKVYQGLRANPPVYKEVVNALGGPEADTVLRDLYEVSKRVTDARANVLTTGKANQALLQSIQGENLVQKVLDSTIARGVATAGAALGGGPVAAGATSALTSALASGRRDALRSAGKLFTSEEFKRLAVEASIGEASPAAVRALAVSRAFSEFARAVKLPGTPDARERWILGALSAYQTIEEGR